MKTCPLLSITFICLYNCLEYLYSRWSYFPRTNLFLDEMKWNTYRDFIFKSN